jgi:hypothetical protein
MGRPLHPERIQKDIRKELAGAPSEQGVPYHEPIRLLKPCIRAHYDALRWIGPRVKIIGRGNEKYGQLQMTDESRIKNLHTIRVKEKRLPHIDQLQVLVKLNGLSPGAWNTKYRAPR